MKIYNTMKEKEFLDPLNAVLDPPFITILEHLNTIKLKPPTIDPYHGTKEPINHVQTFQFHMHFLKS